jgi:hypothetical protein
MRVQVTRSPFYAERQRLLLGGLKTPVFTRVLSNALLESYTAGEGEIREMPLPTPELRKRMHMGHLLHASPG